MYITINGHLGSGKSEICKFFKNQLGYDVFSTGRIQREKALSEGISTLELNEQSKSDYSLDYLIDNALVEYSKQNISKDVIFDSRLAWHFVPDSFKIHLLVSPAVAGQRVYNNRSLKEEKYSSEEDAMNQLIERRRLEEERYFLVYNVKMNDFKNYNLILDTTSLTIDEVCEVIYNELLEYKKGNYKNKIIASPKNVYPSKKLSETEENEEKDVIDIIHYNDAMFVVNGHKKLLKAIRDGKKIIEANLVFDENEDESGKSAKDYISVDLKDINEWEKENDFSFSYYPIK